MSRHSYLIISQVVKRKMAICVLGLQERFHTASKSFDLRNLILTGNPHLPRPWLASDLQLNIAHQLQKL